MGTRVRFSQKFWDEVETFFDRRSGGLTAEAAESPLLENPFERLVPKYISDISSDLSAPGNGTDNNKLKFVYTAMHGVGTPMVKRMLSAFGFKGNLMTGEAWQLLCLSGRATAHHGAFHRGLVARGLFAFVGPGEAAALRPRQACGRASSERRGR